MTSSAAVFGGLVLFARLAVGATVTLQEGVEGYAGFSDACVQLNVTTPVGSEDYLHLYWSSG